MRIETAFAACEDLVRRHDPDRYLSALFAPAGQRPYLFALYAFNYEIARAAEAVREPMMAEIRLQWWREAVEAAAGGAARDHEVAVALGPLLGETNTPASMLIALTDSRSLDAPAETFAGLAALEAYADASSGGVMRAAARVLGASAETDPLAEAAGIGLGLTGLLRALPFHAARRKLYLPLDLLAAEGLTPDEIFAGARHGDCGARLKAVMHCVGERARSHLAAASAPPKPGRALAAILPAAPSSAYLALMAKPGFDPFATRAELPTWRRQLSMLGASIRGHL